MGRSAEMCTTTWMRKALGGTRWNINWPLKIVCAFRSYILMWIHGLVHRIVFLEIVISLIWLDGGILWIILLAHWIMNGRLSQWSCTINIWPICLFKHLIGADQGFLWLSLDAASAMRSAWAFWVYYRIMVDVDERRSVNDASSNWAEVAGMSHVAFMSRTLTLKSLTAISGQVLLLL
jgi:hypothetical protein